MTMFAGVFNRRFSELGFDVMSQLNGFSSFSTSTGSDHLAINNNNNSNTIVSLRLMADGDESMRNDESLAASSSKDHNNIVPGDDNDDDDGGDEEWLQLSIGGQPVKRDDDKITDDGSNNSTNLVELQLMPSRGSNINNKSDDSAILGRIPEFRAPRPVVTTFISPYLLQQQQQQHNYNPAGMMTNFMPYHHHHHHHHHQEMNWALIRPMPISLAAAATTQPSSSSSSGRGVDNMRQPGPAGLDFIVIQPPRRPHSGIWFMLQASQNQEKEPFLPQISKSYLRIKDGRMTIRLVIKYLANKLRMENESEIELRCKGQKLQAFLTLQHVRDDIWSNPRDFITLLPNSSTTQHIMVLHYSRTASN